MRYLTLTVECETIRVSIPSGSILFSSTPPGADIYLIASGGGPPVNTTLQTPNTISDLPVGNYDCYLKLTGFEDYVSTVTVNADETTPVVVNFVPKSTMAPVIVAASGASVLGLLLATTARSAIPLTTGKLGGEIVAVRL